VKRRRGVLMFFKIGIVGGSGYIGSSLARHFSRNFAVKVLDVRPPPEIYGRVEYVYCDVRSFEEVKKCLSDVDLVIHAAIVQIPLINEQKRLGYEVNILGTQNVCEAVEENPQVRGMILASSWHTIGESGLEGVVDEEFGFRPDKVEDRARLYALSKIAQESIVRFYDEMSQKIFGIIRMGTVLGEGMPEKTAANVFIERALRGESITPYKHSMYRPMLYVDIEDVCKAYERFAIKVLKGEVEKTGNSLAHIVNVYYPSPITILDLAQIVQKTVMKLTNNAICPRIEIIDIGQKPLFRENDKNRIKVSIKKAAEFLGLDKLKSPEESIEEIVRRRLTRKMLA
jgi:nucleoside-diphosphate-sugar epimerase